MCIIFVYVRFVVMYKDNRRQQQHKEVFMYITPDQNKARIMFKMKIITIIYNKNNCLYANKSDKRK